MNNIALGKYLPLDSIIHHMDPRAKIGAMLIMMIAILYRPAMRAMVSLRLRSLELLCWHAVCRFLWRAMKPMLFMLTFLLIINLLVIRDGDVLFTIFSFLFIAGDFSRRCISLFVLL